MLSYFLLIFFSSQSEGAERTNIRDRFGRLSEPDLGMTPHRTASYHSEEGLAERLMRSRRGSGRSLERGGGEEKKEPKRISEGSLGSPKRASGGSLGTPKRASEGSVGTPKRISEGSLARENSGMKTLPRNFSPKFRPPSEERTPHSLFRDSRDSRDSVYRDFAVEDLEEVPVV